MIKLKIMLINLLLESSGNAKLLYDFIKQEIRGSEWENIVYAVGGYPRDVLMKKEPKDLDLMVDKKEGGIEFSIWLTKKLGIYKTNSNPIIYKKFGTAKFNLRGINYKGVDLSNFDIEAVMPRSEKYVSGSRKPEVQFTNLKNDADRRDLTINSLFQKLSNDEVYDLTGMGLNDIKNKIIRTPLDPNIIFKDDPLRMLRLIRFSVKYNFNIPLFMIKSLKKNASMLKTISSERIRDELDKMLVTSFPDKAVRLLQITNLSKYVFPELDLLIGLKQNKYHLWDANKHTLEVLRGVPNDVKTRLAALFHDIGKSQTKSIIDGDIHFYEHEDISAEIAKDIMTRLRYPNDIINSVYVAIKNHMRLKSSGNQGEIISDKALRKLKDELGQHLEMTLDLMDSDNKAHSPQFNLPNQISNIRNRIRNLKTPEKIILPVDGNDIMKIFNLKPGPQIGQILDYVKDLYFENPNITKDQIIKILKRKQVK